MARSPIATVVGGRGKGNRMEREGKGVQGTVVVVIEFYHVVVVDFYHVAAESLGPCGTAVEEAGMLRK